MAGIKLSRCKKCILKETAIGAKKLPYFWNTTLMPQHLVDHQSLTSPDFKIQSNKQHPMLVRGVSIWENYNESIHC